MKQAPKGYDEKDKRVDLGARLRRMIDAYRADMSGRISEWQETRDVYDEKITPSSLIYMDDVEPYNVPILKQRVDALGSAVCDPITSSKPAFILSGMGIGDNIIANAQKTLHKALKDAMFDRRVRDAAFYSGLHGRGILRIRYETRTDDLIADEPEVEVQVTGQSAVQSSEEGEVQLPSKGLPSYSGLIIDAIAPKDFIVYPTSAENVSDALLVGHQFLQVREDIEMKKAIGRYFDDITVPASDEQKNDSTKSPPVVDSPNDGPLLCYDLVVRLVPEGGTKMKRYRVTVLYNTQEVLDLEDYPYPMPWYFAPGYRYEAGQFWPEQSVAESLLGIQTINNDAWTELIAGVAATAMSGAVVTGYTGESEIRNTPGTILTLKQAAQVFPLPIKFDSNGPIFMITHLPEIADSLSRVSQAALSQNFEPSTTATAVNSVMAGQVAGINEFTESFGLELERMAGFALYLLAMNWDAFKGFMGDAVPTVSKKELMNRFDIDLNGKSQSNSPQIVMQKIQMLLKFLSDLGIQPKQGIKMLNIDGAIDMLINSLDLPMSVDQLFVDNDGTQNGQNQTPPGANPGTPSGIPANIPPGILQLLQQLAPSLLQGLGGGQTGVPPQLPPGQDPGMPPGVGVPGIAAPAVPSLPPPGSNPGMPPAPLG